MLKVFGSTAAFVRKVAVTVLMIAFILTEPLKYAVPGVVPDAQLVCRWALLIIGGVTTAWYALGAVYELLQDRPKRHPAFSYAMLLACVISGLLLWWSVSHPMLYTSEPLTGIPLIVYCVVSGISLLLLVLMWWPRKQKPQQQSGGSPPQQQPTAGTPVPASQSPKQLPPAQAVAPLPTGARKS